MSKVDLRTDFTALTQLLLTGRQLPAAHLFIHIHDSRVLGNVDQQLVKDTMKTIDEDTRLVDEAMQDCEKLRMFLSSHLKDLRYKSAGYSSLLGPIRRLPVDILQEIFVLVETARCRQVGTDDRRNRPPPTSQVNYHWRSIALGTPSFWATSVVTLGRIGTTLDGQTEALRLNLRMQRSDPLPISLIVETTTRQMPLRYEDEFNKLNKNEDLEYDDYYQYRQVRRREAELKKLVYELNAEATEIARGAILPYLHRLGSVIILQYSSTLEVFLEALGTDAEGKRPMLPQLKRIALPAETWAKNRTLPFYWAPNLEKIAIDSAGYPRVATQNAIQTSGPWEGIPWQTPSVFHGPLSDSDFTTLVDSQSDQLRIAAIVAQNVPPAPKAPSETIHLPLRNLTTLHLQADSIPSFPNSLPPLPALKHLLLQPGRSGDKTVPEGRLPMASKAAIVALVGAWGSQLAYFGLDLSTTPASWTSPAFVSSDMRDIIAATPRLEALALPSNWLGELDYIFPRLRRLSHVEILSHFDGCFLRLGDSYLKRPQWSYEKLNRLRTLTFCCSDSPRDAKKLAEHHQLDVVISSWQPLYGWYRSTRFSTPYFILQGGMFPGCASDGEV